MSTAEARKKLEAQTSTLEEKQTNQKNKLAPKKKRNKREKNEIPTATIPVSNEFIRSNIKNKHKALALYFLLRAQHPTLLEEYKSFTITTNEIADILELKYKEQKHINEAVKKYLTALEELDIICANTTRLDKTKYSIDVKLERVSKNFTYLHKSVLDNKNVYIELLPLYSVLNSYAYTTFNPTIDALTKETSQSTNKVMKQIKALEELNLIQVVNQCKQVNKYIVHNTKDILNFKYEPRIVYQEVVKDNKKDLTSLPQEVKPNQFEESTEQATIGIW